MKLNNKGFALVELIVVLGIICGLIFSIYCVIQTHMLNESDIKAEAKYTILESYPDATDFSFHNFEYESEDDDYELDVSFKYDGIVKTLEVDCECLCLSSSINCEIDRDWF